jgi:hypothetical protein
MEQKTIWTRFLLTGINIIFTFLLISCEGKDKNIGPLNIKVIYVNNTESNIGYFQSEGNQRIFVFEIAPKERHIIDIQTEFDNSKGLNSVECCNGVFESFQGNNDILITFDDTLCLLFKSGEGSTTQNIESYTVLQTSSNSIQYTYTFTEADYDTSVDCE